jgi:uncharacterized protein (TIGR03663 family)
VAGDNPAAMNGLRRFPSWLPAAAPWLLLLLALAVRLPSLPLRPPHSDEGVNGWFADKVVAGGFYRYDPENYHGPLHFYALAASQVLFGRNLWALRLPTVLLGAFAVWLAARCADALGRRTAWTAALFLALSPGLILYARWAIHETWFLFFSLLAFRGICRFQARGGRVAVWQVGIGVTGLLATKEVWIIHVVSALAAWGLWRLSRRLLHLDAAATTAPVAWRHVALAAVAGVATLALLYSGFGHDPQGLARFFAPYSIWADRAMEGAGHEKPWHYWLALLARYEQPALLGLVASPLAAWLAPPALRLLAIYGPGVLVAYSLIPYKTPWCVVQLIWPLAFVAAWLLGGAAERFTAFLPTGEPPRRERWAAAWRRSGAVAALLLAIASVGVAWRLNALRYDAEREPYVYVQVYRNGLDPVHLLRRLATADPALFAEPVHVVMKLSWPIPWLLSDFAHAGHWSAERLPPGDAAVLFVDEPHVALVEPLLRRRYQVFTFDPSPVHATTRAYFDAERFAGRLPAGATVFEPPAAVSPPVQ